MSEGFDLKNLHSQLIAGGHARQQNNQRNPDGISSVHVTSVPYSMPSQGDRTSPAKLPAITVFRGHHRNSSLTNKSASDRNRYLGHRRRRSVKFTADQDSKILSLRQQGLTWMEIAKAVGIESNSSARNRHSVLLRQQEEDLTGVETSTSPSTEAMNPGPPVRLGSPLPSIQNFYGTPIIQTRPIKWNSGDILCLKMLLEGGERAKWKFIANEVSRARGKRIPALACQKKFKEMYGVAESSSILGSSLSYVVFPEGWSCLTEDKLMMQDPIMETGISNET